MRYPVVIHKDVESVYGVAVPTWLLFGWRDA